MAAHPSAVRATAFVALFVAACGSGQHTTGGALGDASQDAFPGADAGDASAEGGGDAGADATPEHGVSPSKCTEPADGGALAETEVIASGRSGLAQIRTTDFGPVWMEFESEPDVSMGPAVVFLGSTSAPPRELFACTYNAPASLETSARHFEVFCGGTTIDRGGDFSIGDIGTGAVATWHVLDCGAAGGPMDESSVYEQGLDITGALPASPPTVDVAPLDSPCMRTKLLDLGTDGLLGTAIDDSRLYALVVKDNALRRYAIYSVAKSGGAQVMLTEGIADPGAWSSQVTLRAHNGTLAWAYFGSDWPPEARFVEVLPHGSSTARTLVDEPDGIAQDWNVAITLDDEYLYWTTRTGFVKRVRLCGGTPEVIAENQKNPIAIAVDDRAVYWLDYGSTSPWQDLNFWLVDDGKGMGMRKLDAPGYAEAGTDAGVTDASAGDADASD